MNQNQLNYTKILLLITIIIVCVSSTMLLFIFLKGYFRSDDFWHIVDNRRLEEISQKLFIKQRDNFYRPLGEIVITLEYKIFNIYPIGYYIINLMLYLINLGFILLILQLITQNILIGLINVILFALQINIYIWQVSWATNVFNLISMLFILISLAFYINFEHKSILIFILVPIPYLLGLLSKEISIITIFLFIGVDILLRRKRLKLLNSLLYYLTFIIVMKIYFFLRMKADVLFLPSSYKPTIGINVLNNALFHASQLGFLPLVIFIIYVIMYRRYPELRLEEREKRFIYFGLLWAVLGVLPVLTMAWHSPTHLYTPAFGTTIAASVLCTKILTHSPPKRSWQILAAGLTAYVLVLSLGLGWQLEQVRFLKWGEYTKGALQGLKTLHPSLVSETTVYFLDRDFDKPYGMRRLFGSGFKEAVQLWYNDFSLKAYYFNESQFLELFNKLNSDNHPILFFEYTEGIVRELKPEDIKALRQATGTTEELLLP